MYEISWLACKGVGYSKILIPKDNVGVISSYLIRLNSLNVRAEIGRQSLSTYAASKASFYLKMKSN